MKKFKRTRKIVALLLSLSLITGMMPATALSAFAAEEKPYDAAIIFSDAHTKKDNYKESTFAGIFGALKDTGLPFTTVTSAGDMFSVNEDSGKYTGYTSKISKAIHDGLGDSSIPVNYTWSDHDRYAVQEDDTTLLSNDSGFVYGEGDDGILGTGDDENYYIYSLSMADLSTNNRYKADFHTNEEVTETIGEFASVAGTLKTDRPLFVVSHQPLFDRRDDNGHAAEWFAAINDVAETMDVAFFFGHNHKYDITDDYCYAKGSTMPVAQSDLSSKNETLNFTHMCAGYMDPSTTGSTSNTTRQGTVVAASIYDSKIVYQTYNKDGIYSGNYALNHTVEREFAEVEKSVTYADDLLTIQATAVGLTAIDAENVYGEPDLSDYFTDYIAYDVDLKGHTQGNEIKYSFLFVDDMDDSNICLYHVGEDETLTPIEYEMVTDVQGGHYIEFTSALTGTFAYGAPTVPEGYMLSELRVSNVTTKSYFVGDSLDMTEPVVKAVYRKEGSADFTRIISIKDDYVVFDGYTISGFDMNKAGKQTVTISYEGVTTSFDIRVYEKKFVDKESGVAVEPSAPGVTKLIVNLVPKSDRVVSHAVSHVLKDYVAYDIGVKGHNSGDAVTVTLPMPEGVTNPAVYYVSDDGMTVDNMSAVKSTDGDTVTFVTDHFSTYVVGEDKITEDLKKEETINSTSYVEKTVYVRVNTPENNGKYLIVSDNGSTAFVNNNGTEDTATVTIKNEAVKVDGTSYDSYIELENPNAVWTANAKTDGFTFGNAGQYIISRANYDMLSSKGSTWAYDSENNRLKTGAYYLAYSSDSGWARTKSTSDTTIYLYKEVTAQIPIGSTDTYKLNVDDLEHILEPSAEGYQNTEKLNPSVLVNGEVVNNLGGTYSFQAIDLEDENAIITSIDNDGTVTFNGKSGQQYVKVSYTWTRGTSEHTVYKYATVSAVEPYYGLSLHLAETTVDENGNVTAFAVGEEITKPIVIKNVKVTDEFDNLWAVISKNGEDLGQLTEEQLSKLKFETSDDSIATVDSKNGKVTFTGKSGLVVITASYEYEEGLFVTDTAVFSVSEDQYYVPEDGTNDFPEYPNEGSVRFDKTATAVGSFSKTGITQVELSMTGVPYTTGNRMDVVLMLDRSSSMKKASIDRIGITIEATEAFIKNIVINEDGSFNDNRIIVADFLGGNLAKGSQHKFESNVYTENEDNGYQVINDQNELEDLLETIRTGFEPQDTLYGTDYGNGLNECYKALQKSKTDGNKQFCVFMSDGIPNYYQGESKLYESTGDIVKMFTANGSVTSSTVAISRNSTAYQYEKYSSLMKNDGVTVFTVGLGLLGTNSSWTVNGRNASAEACEQVGSYLLNDISGPAGEKSTDRNTGNTLNKLNEYFFNVADTDAAAQMKDVFTNIAQKIMEAAKDVKVTDSITDKFTMIFEAPNPTVGGELPEGQEFYIEVKDYKLVPVYKEPGNASSGIVDYKRDENANSLVKIYMGTEGNNYYAATDASGTKASAPAFNTTPLGTKLYWTKDATDGDSGVSVVGAEGITYYFISTGKGTHNMISGAYAHGTITTEKIQDAATPMSEEAEENKTCEDLIIATPYFVYNANTKMLVWTVEKLTSSELALSYFLYLENSGGYSGAENETLAGTYETNNYAVMLYSNFQNHECEQFFPVPQVTWNGARVTYVFYLVNDAGQPVNRAGRVVPFSEAVYVTDPSSYTVIWNDEEQISSLEAEYLAQGYVPDVYELYDPQASYNVHVFEDEHEANLNNHFVIGQTDKTVNTTYVFNKKSDADKYKAPGTYAATSNYSCKEYANVTVNQTGADEYGNPIYEGKYTGGKSQYKDENGKVIYGIDEKGAYTIVNMSGANVAHAGFDFSNTTVAFAVKWKPALVPDTVVIDYGLDVVIDVAKNDALAGGVTGVMSTQPNATMNSGSYNKSVANASIDLNIANEKVATAIHESQEAVRVSLDKQNGMHLTEPLNFYYESEVKYKDKDDDVVETNMYSSVTVIPATTIYYEDDFLTYSANNTEWIDEGAEINATQAQDRPGASKISEALDADNLYGYDAAYSQCSEFSLGSAKKVHVNSDSFATAEFDFYGTGFDVVSMTSNTTGTIAVKVTAAEDVVVNDETVYAKGQKVKAAMVNTYYGYTYKDGEWIAIPDVANSLYQVPVMQIEELPYGKYNVVITATYASALDQTTADGYDLYIDSIRIYNPTGNINADANTAYVTDGEAYPEYYEVRNEIIEAETFNSLGDNESVSGMVFIDGAVNTNSVANYTAYGPNNEVYLQPGQAIAFDLNATATSGELSKVQLAVKTVGGTGSVEVYGVATNGNKTKCLSKTISTATDMYYDITALNGKTVVIKNSGDSNGSTVSITNVKTTYTVEQPKDDGTQAETAKPAMFMVSRASVKNAIATLNAPAVPEQPDTPVVPDTPVTPEQPDTPVVPDTPVTPEQPDTPVVPDKPEVDEPEPEKPTVDPAKIVSVKTDKKTYTQGDKVKVTVTTNSAATKVKVGTKTLKTFKTKNGKKTWTTTVKASKIGKLSINAVAYNKEGTATKKVTKEVTVKQFAPKKFNVTLSKSKVKKGAKYTVTVKTSTNVKYVKVNGKKITKFTTDKKKTTRTFKITYKAAKVGKKTVKVVSYNKAGYASKAKTKTVTVKRK